MIYLDSPPADPNTDALFVYFFTHNLRSKLKGEWSGRLNYPGCAIGMSVLRFPVTAIAAAASKGKKDAILASALLVKAEYEAQASLGALGTAFVRLEEIMSDIRKTTPGYALDHISSMIDGLMAHAQHIAGVSQIYGRRHRRTLCRQGIQRSGRKRGSRCGHNVC